MQTISETDRRIIKEMSSDCRRSLRRMARKLGISVTTLAKRVDNLEKAGIIQGYSAVVDPEKLGYDLTTAIEVVASKGKLVEVEKEIARNPNVFAVYDMTGETDALVLARFRKRSELNVFIKSMLAMGTIERTNTHLVLNVVKSDHRVIA
jgi:DNA-binding Lrp family transcriptional regulator